MWKTYVLKECSIRLVSLESILFPKTKTSGSRTPSTPSNSTPVANIPSSAGNNKDATAPAIAVEIPQPNNMDQDGDVPVTSQHHVLQVV